MTDEQIIEALGAASAPAQLQEVMVANARKVVGLRTATIVEEMLTPEQQQIYEQLQNAGNDQAVWDWLRSDVIGADTSEVYEATLRSYIDEVNSQIV